MTAPAAGGWHHVAYTFDGTTHKLYLDGGTPNTSTTAANTARRASELSLIQYKAGEADYTTVLSTEQAQLSVEDSVASSQGNVALGLISIYRALGGGWEIRHGRDVISDEVKAEMGQRTNWGKMLKPEQHLPKVSPVAEP